MAKFAAIDVGGTKIAIGIGNAEGGIDASETLATNQDWSTDEVLDRIAEVVKRLAPQAGVRVGEIVRAGVGTPGPLDGPVLLDTSNLHGWKGLNWETGLHARLNIPVSVENDATAAGVGEWLFGAGRGTKDCLYVTVSTGVGAGIIVAGRRYSGSHGNAGEFGHLVMDPDGLPCPAGHRGCLETVASGTAIRRLGRERQHDSPYLSHLEEVDTKDVFDGYLQSDPVCTEVVEFTADRLALGLSYLVNLFNPELIVLGGGVGAHAPRAYRQRLSDGINRWALAALAETVRLVPAQLGEDSGLVGALALAVMESGNLT